MDEEWGPSGLGRMSRQVGPYISLGVEFTAAILICLGLGWWADRRFQTIPLLTILGAFFGMAAGFYRLYRTVLGLQEKDRRRTKRSGEG